MTTKTTVWSTSRHGLWVRGQSLLVTALDSLLWLSRDSKKPQAAKDEVSGNALRNVPNSCLKLLSETWDKPVGGAARPLPEWEASRHATWHVSTRASEETSSR